jgi:hypothetical protein
MPRKMARPGCPTAVRARAMVGSKSALRAGLAGGPESSQYSRQVGIHLGNPGLIEGRKWSTYVLKADHLGNVG